MVFELLVGMKVTDEDAYQKYREGMLPILQSYGGGFSYDFRVSEVLKAESDTPMNRVFTIYFSDEEASNEFFSNEQYLQVKAQYYEGSVDSDSVTVIASYQVDRNKD